MSFLYLLIYQKSTFMTADWLRKRFKPICYKIWLNQANKAYR